MMKDQVESMKFDQSDSKEKIPKLRPGMQKSSFISLSWPSDQLLPRATEDIYNFCSFMPESYNSTEQTGKLLHTPVS